MNNTRQKDLGNPVAPASHRSKWQDGFEARAKRQGDIVEA